MINSKPWLCYQFPAVSDDDRIVENRRAFDEYCAAFVDCLRPVAQFWRHLVVI